MHMVGRLKDYLSDSIQECADKVVKLIEDRQVAEELRKEWRKHIKNNFMMPRLVSDKLPSIKSLIGG